MYLVELNNIIMNIKNYKYFMNIVFYSKGFNIYDINDNSQIHRLIITSTDKETAKLDFELHFYEKEYSII